MIILGGFCYHRNIKLCFVSTEINSEKCVELLDDVLIEYLDEMPDLCSPFYRTIQYFPGFKEINEVIALYHRVKDPYLDTQNIWGTEELK